MALFQTFPWTGFELNLNSIDLALTKKIQLLFHNRRFSPGILTSHNGRVDSLLKDIRSLHVKPDTISVQATDSLTG